MATRFRKHISSRQDPTNSGSTAGWSAGQLRGVLLAAAALLWAGAAIAQQNPGMQGPPMQQQQQQTPGTSSAGSPSTGVPTEGTPGTSSEEKYSDMVFVQDALQSDTVQVQMSQIAQTKSQSPDVKQFGEKMVQVHTALNSQLKPVADQLGVKDSKGPSKKEKQQIDQLASLSGPDFDTAYIMAMAKQQQKSLRAFKDEANNAQSPGLQKAAKADEPVLSEHYQVLETLARAHNVTISATK